MIEPDKLNKTVVLDGCVDGDETRFDNLIGKDFDEFNVIYDIIKRNAEVLSNKIQCEYPGNDQVQVRIPTTETNVTKLNLPADKPMNVAIEQGYLVVNITVKKEW